jgi:hypothetical protein
MRALLVAVVSLLIVSCSSASRGPAPGSQDRGLPDRDVEALMAREKVVGLALALIDEGQVVKVATYGKRNLERGLPLEPDTVMYGASLTKTAFAYMLLQLASEGRLDLDAPLTQLLPRPLPDYRLANAGISATWRWMNAGAGSRRASCSRMRAASPTSAGSSRTKSCAFTSTPARAMPIRPKACTSCS